MPAFVGSRYLTAPKTVFDFYVDSVRGNDNNSGTCINSPKQTLAGIVALNTALANKRIGLAKGSIWREQIALPQNGMHFDTYGSGNNPLIMGSELTSLTWSPYSGSIAAGNILTNSDFENWTDGTPDLTNWTTFETAPSVVNQIAGHTGSFAVELSVGSANENVVISQTVGYVPNQVLSLAIDHQEPDGGLFGYQIQISGGPDALKFLQADGSWSLTDPGNQGPAVASATWATYTRTVTMPNSTGNLVFRLKRKQAPSGGTPYRLWLDNIHLDSAAITIPPDCYQATLTPQTWLVRILDTVMHLGISANTLQDGEYFWQSNTLFVRDSRGTPPSQVEIGTRNSAITGVGKTNFFIQNVDFLNFNDRIIFMNTGSHNGIIRFCNFDGCGRKVDNGSISWDHSNGFEIAYCTFKNTHNDAIYSFNGKDARILYNRIGKCDGPAADGIQFDYYTDGTNGNGANANCLVEGNYVDQRGAISLKGCIICTQGDGFIIRNNQTFGGTFGIAPNGNNQIIENNIIRFSGIFGGLRIAKAYSKDNNIYRNNLITDGLIGIDTEFALESGEHLNGTEKLTNCQFLNNTIVNCTQYGVNFQVPMGGTFLNNVIDCPSVSGDVFRMVSVASGGTWTSDFNNFYPQQTNYLAFNTTTATTLSAWQASPRAYDAGSITLAPVYIDAANGYYGQTPSSPSYGWGYIPV